MAKTIVKAKVKNKVATISPNRPRWQDVYEGYPKEGDNDLPAKYVFHKIFNKKTIESQFFNVKTGYYSNACATRLSLGLLNGGVKLRASFIIELGEFKGKGIITSATGMIDFLNKRFGLADIKIDYPNNIETVREKLINKKGIYAMQPIDGAFETATGHVTLWTGNDVIGKHDYADVAKVVYFWELK